MASVRATKKHTYRHFVSSFKEQKWIGFNIPRVFVTAAPNDDERVHATLPMLGCAGVVTTALARLTRL